MKFHYKFAEKAQPLYVKVALSVVDPEGAEKNLEAELPGWDFDKTREESTHIWNEALNLIQIEADPKVMVNFYTALYHTMIAPSLIKTWTGVIWVWTRKCIPPNRVT